MIYQITNNSYGDDPMTPTRDEGMSMLPTWNEDPGSTENFKMFIQHVCLCDDVHFHCNTHGVLIYIILPIFDASPVCKISLTKQYRFRALSSPNRGRSNVSLPLWPPLIRMMSRSARDSRPT